MSSHQYVYVMHRLSKAWPGGKEVLKNISLSFLPGAKIGVLGLNGAGKSTLFHLISGKYQPSSGRITFRDQEIQNHPPYEICL